MKKVLIIGYGNTLRGDDAAGIRAAESLAKRSPHFEYVYVHQLMPELAENISECDIVFFIDADVTAVQPSAKLIEAVTGTEQPRTHFISPESLLGLSKHLYQKIPSKAYVVGIPASQFEFSEELSATTASAVEESVQLVETTIHSVSAPS